MNRKAILSSLLLGTVLIGARAQQPVTLTIQADQPPKAISPDLFGIFFEDLSYAADGGLYAELIQNRSSKSSVLISSEMDAPPCSLTVIRIGS